MLKHHKNQLKFIVIWDKDGVLADTHPYLVDMLNETFRHIEGHNRNPWSIEKTIHPTTRHVIFERYAEPETAQRAFEYFLNLYQKRHLHIPSVKGAMESMRHLHSNGIIQGICTNDGQQLLYAYAQEHRLTDYIKPELMIGIERGKTEGKPKTDTMELLFARICEHHHLQLDEIKKLPIYMIDDSKPAIEMVEAMWKKGFDQLYSIVFDTHSLHAIAEHKFGSQLHDNARLHKLYLSQIIINDHAMLRDFFISIENENIPLSYLAKIVSRSSSTPCPSRH